ncbi:MAG TPA: PHB depolymerase family esterase [Acidimicrobiia bacterium]|nr:PHB depolymerase family esterase [Acidimicrobiia bacterium]
MTRLLRLAAGCSVVVALVTVGAGPVGATPKPDRSEGCGQPAHAPGVTPETLTTADGVREYRLAIPDRYTGKKPLPLVLNFHGLGSNAEQQAAYSELEEKGPARNYIVITPEGQKLAGFGFWNVLPELASPDDVGFVGALIDNAAATLCIDTRRVYATGMSNGGGMAAYLGCNLGDRLAAIAPVAGVNLEFGPCTSEERVPVIAFHGQRDAIVPYYGGPLGILLLQDRILPAADEAVAQWGERDGCKTPPKNKSVSEHVQLIDYSGCKAKTDVQLYSVSDGGHTWPGSIPVGPLGETTTEINATDLILDFFDKHARRD